MVICYGALPVEAGMVVAFDRHRAKADVCFSKQCAQTEDGDGAKPQSMEFAPWCECSMQKHQVQTKATLFM